MRRVTVTKPNCRRVTDSAGARKRSQIGALTHLFTGHWSLPVCVLSPLVSAGVWCVGFAERQVTFSLLCRAVVRVRWWVARSLGRGRSLRVQQLQAAASRVGSRAHFPRADANQSQPPARRTPCARTLRHDTRTPTDRPTYDGTHARGEVYLPACLRAWRGEHTECTTIRTCPPVSSCPARWLVCSRWTS